MVEMIGTVIAGVCAVISVASLVANYHQTRRGWHVNVFAPQRLEWAENVRVAVSEFLSAFYEQKELLSHRAKILLYLNPKNEEHTKLIKAIDAVCDGEVSEPSDIISITQNMLRWNWWLVKSEAGVSHSEEEQRDKAALERAQRHDSRGPKA